MRKALLEEKPSVQISAGNGYPGAAPCESNVCDNYGTVRYYPHRPNRTWRFLLLWYLGTHTGVLSFSYAAVCPKWLLVSSRIFFDEYIHLWVGNLDSFLGESLVNIDDY